MRRVHKDRRDRGQDREKEETEERTGEVDDANNDRCDEYIHKVWNFRGTIARAASLCDGIGYAKEGLELSERQLLYLLD